MNTSDPTGNGLCFVWQSGCQSFATSFDNSTAGQFANGLASGLTGGISSRIEARLGAAPDQCSLAYQGGEFSSLPVLAVLTGGTGDALDGDAIVDGWEGTNMSALESFAYHVATHGGGMTEADYDAAAQAWAAAPSGNSKPDELADGSWGVKWRTPGGGPGGILSANGNIVSYWTT